MIDKCDFTDLNGERWQFNTASCPLHDYSVDYDVSAEGDEDERMQEHGIWPHRTYLGKCLIHLEGQVLSDSTSLYVADVMRMKRIIMPKNERQTQRKLGTLALRYTGMTEDMKADVTLDGSPNLPKAANYPTVGDFFVTFKAFSPYFIGVGTGKSYLV